MTVSSLYSSVVSCPLACSEIVRDAHTNIPRGFFTQGKAGDPIQLLVIAQNSGQPWGPQHGAYQGLRPSAMVAKQFELVNDAMLGINSRTFQKRLVSWLSTLLSVPAQSVFKHVVYSNVVKCTTPNDKKPSLSLARTCATRHLLKEVAFWKPKLVVGLGSASSSYLSRIGIEHESLPHPSNRESAHDNLAIVLQLKSRFLNILPKERLVE